jgi:type II secretory pathway predicted ATPase ExeA
MRERLAETLEMLRAAGTDEDDLRIMQQVFITGALAAQSEMLAAMILDLDSQARGQDGLHMRRVNRELSALSRETDGAEFPMPRHRM